MRLIKKLASNNSTKNIEYEKKKFVESLEKNQMAEVKAKLETVHILLNKEVSFAKGVEVDETTKEKEEKEDVNLLMGLVFRIRGLEIKRETKTLIVLTRKITTSTTKIHSTKSTSTTIVASSTTIVASSPRTMEFPLIKLLLQQLSKARWGL